MNVLSPPPTGLGAVPAPSALADIPTIAGSLPIVLTITGPMPTSAAQQPVEPMGETGAILPMESALCNFLAVSISGPALGSPWVYMGKGLPTILIKLTKCILRWDFVDMAELLLEYWGVVSGAKLGTESQNSIKPTRKMKVTNMTWVQCFVVYTSIMAAKH